jgi:hypothetical protein
VVGRANGPPLTRRGWKADLLGDTGSARWLCSAPGRSPDVGDVMRALALASKKLADGRVVQHDRPTYDPKAEFSSVPAGRCTRRSW